MPGECGNGGDKLECKQRRSKNSSGNIRAKVQSITLQSHSVGELVKPNMRRTTEKWPGVGSGEF